MPRYGYNRKYNGSLTGGSGDVNPQYMHLSATQTGADTATTVTFPIPIQRLQNAGRAQVMEILKVFWSVDLSVEVDSVITFVLSTANTAAQTYGSTRVIDALLERMGITTSGTFDHVQPICHDLTDGAGHGFLVATDNIFLQLNSVTTGQTLSCNVKILYRWKDVSTTEYVGIVQGQQ